MPDTQTRNMDETLALMRANEKLPAPGDRVRYTGSDYSMLFFGPGIVTKVWSDGARVRPTVLGNLKDVFPSARPVENREYIFGLANLEVIPPDVVDPVQWFKLICECGYTSAARPYDEVKAALATHRGGEHYARIAPEKAIRCGACITGKHAEAHLKT